MPMKIKSDFIDSLSIRETADLMYVFSFMNSPTGNRYFLQISKKLFDVAMDERIILEENIIDTFDPEAPENQYSIDVT